MKEWDREQKVRIKSLQSTVIKLARKHTKTKPGSKPGHGYPGNLKGTVHLTDQESVCNSVKAKADVWHEL